MTEKLSGAVIKCSFTFTEGQDAEGFSPYDLIRQWAHTHVNNTEGDTGIWLDDQDLVSTEPWYELKQVKINIPGRDEPFVSDKEMEQQYRADANKVTQAGFLRYILKGFGITYEYTSTSD